MGFVSMGLLVVAIAANSSVAFLIGMGICCIGAVVTLRAERLAVIALLALSLNCSAQAWSPAKTTTVTTTVTRVQCFGTTTKAARCKRMIDPKAPAHAVKDAGGVYYCAQHAKQAK